MDPVARKKLNLKVLQKHDPAINDILDQSAHAVVYKFEPENKSWDKLGFEGVLFLTRRQVAPYFGLYMLNRLVTENFSLFLTDFEEIELKDNVIMYQTKQGDARALWLFEEKDRERILNKVIKLHESMKELPSVQAKIAEAEKPAVHADVQNQKKPIENNGGDILQMLQKATLSQPSIERGVGDKEGLLRLLSPDMTPPEQPSPNLHMQQLLLLRQQQQTQQQHQLSQQQQLAQQKQQAEEQQQAQQQLPHGMKQSEQEGQNLLHLIRKHRELRPDQMMQSPGKEHQKALIYSPVASPRGAAALLQTLQGGHNTPYPPTHPSISSPTHLTQIQAIDFTQQEIERRLGKKLLSKSEFIQQFLSMVQNDQSFMDTLYDNYYAHQLGLAGLPHTIHHGQGPTLFPM